ncbi:hypothetical protein BDM02DRAFT_3131512 [Thelephora ganbajun]|uniref:Uncharacterized protein n=1 Tax=Thelephora ganbajun TaxID=370292 RepID=A0ACB6Z629_THEGA|nr:hypothetical protein BDM02DRAFT_3131512 [Thelephora ganbajun]
MLARSSLQVLFISLHCLMDGMIVGSPAVWFPVYLQLVTDAVSLEKYPSIAVEPCNQPEAQEEIKRNLHEEYICTTVRGMVYWIRDAVNTKWYTKNGRVTNAGPEPRGDGQPDNDGGRGEDQAVYLVENEGRVVNITLRLMRVKSNEESEAKKGKTKTVSQNYNKIGRAKKGDKIMRCGCMVETVAKKKEKQPEW